MTEGRIQCLNHELTPDLLRTKPDPDVEQRTNQSSNLLPLHIDAGKLPVCNKTRFSSLLDRRGLMHSVAAAAPTISSRVSHTRGPLASRMLLAVVARQSIRVGPSHRLLPSPHRHISSIRCTLTMRSTTASVLQTKNHSTKMKMALFLCLHRFIYRIQWRQKTTMGRDCFTFVFVPTDLVYLDLICDMRKSVRVPTCLVFSPIALPQRRIHRLEWVMS